MAGSLERLMRIRTLQEEIAHNELEGERVRMRKLERLAGEAAGEARASRERWFAAVESGEAAGSERVAEESAWDEAVWRRSRLERLKAGQSAEVERAQAEYLLGRRERMQVESLVEAAKSLARVDEARTDQRRLDDWFQSRPGWRDPREQDTGAVASKRAGFEAGGAQEHPAEDGRDEEGSQQTSI